MASREIHAVNVDSGSNEMQSVRTLLLGEENSLVKDTVRENARELVTDVISEAIHDRQLKDDSLSRTLIPLVESAVRHSIENDRGKLVRYLYPIVGGLVRKSVAVFFSGFLEKLNYLIEYSLTLKGLKWRFQAWRKGISFADFILRKTFVYRVDQVFFIHRKSGALLNSVALDSSLLDDAALVSAMLIAINDFIVDSFTRGNENDLNIIKTDKFTLAVEAGPQALLVVAVSGAMPNAIRVYLQQTLQELHRRYSKELTAFSGDDDPFSVSDDLLRDCLLSEMNENNLNQRKKPIFAIATLCIVGIFLLVWLGQLFMKNQLINKLWLLQQEPGIHVQAVNLGDGGIPELTVFRDPAAKSVVQWLKEQSLGQHDVTVFEQPFLSLEPAIVQVKASALIANEPGIQFELSGNRLVLSGKTTNALPIAAQQKLLALPNVVQLDMSRLDSPAPPKTHQPAAELALFKQQVSELMQQQLSFDVASADINTATQSKLPAIVKNIELISQLSTELNLAVGIIVSGTSDKKGLGKNNQQLSLQRAANVHTLLLNGGIDPKLLYATGLGEIDLPDIAYDSRKVLFTVIYLKGGIKAEERL